MPEPVDPIRTVAVPHDHESSAASDRDETSPVAPRAEAAPNFGPPAAPGEVGTLGPYRVVRELGKGGMGAVYLALDTRLNRKIALKVMLPEFAADTAAKMRFLREATAAGTISHDNIVTVFEADERDGVPYIVMPLLQGYPLDEYLKTKGAPPLPHVLRIARETALGLAAAHALGLVHRDIKPANLWLEAPNGRVKVLDFGLAKPVGSDAELTRSGAVVGTPAYMSPEQARGLKVDHRTDIFSLGAVLYRLCTGKTPFRGPNVMAVLMALGSDAPAPVRELNPSVPEPLAQFIHQLLSKNPDDRPQTAAEVAKRLRDLLDQTLAAPATGPGGAVPMAQAADLSASQPVVVLPVVVPMSVTARPESAFAHLDDATAPEPAPAAPKLERKKSGGKGMLLAAVGAVLLAGAAVAAVVVLMGKKGEPVAENKPPEGDTGKGSKDRPKPVPNPNPKPPKPVEGPLPPVPAWAGWAPVPAGASPFDKLDASAIPPDERFDYQPKELVAVVGAHAIRRHWGVISSVEMLPGGTTMVTDGPDGIKVWNLATRQVVRTLTRSGYTFARTESQIAGSSRYEVLDVTQPDGAPKPPAFPNADAAKLFGLEAGQLCDVFEGGKTWLCSPANDRHLRRGSGGARLTLVDATGPVPKVLQKIEHRGWASSPGGNWLLYRDLEDKLQFAEVRDGKLTGARVLALPNAAECVPHTISADGKNIAVWVEKEYQVWAVSGEPKLGANVAGGLGTEIVRISPDGSKLGVFSGEGLNVHDVSVAKSRKIGGPVAHSGGSIYPFAFTNDSKHVVTGDGSGHVRFWDVSGDAMRELDPAFDAGTAFVRPQGSGATRPTTQLASAGGQLLLRRYDDTVEAWGVTGSRFAPLVGDGARWPCRAFSDDQRTGGGNSVTRDGSLLKLRTLREGAWREVGALGKWTGTFNLSEDGQLLATPTGIWDLAKNPPAEIWSGQLGGSAVWLSPSKQVLAAQGSWDGVQGIRLFDLRGGQPKVVAAIPQENLYSAAFSPDSRYLAYGGACPLKLIDLSAAQPKELFSHNAGNTSWVTFHPSGKWLVSAGSASNAGGRVHIRSVPDGKVVKQWTFPGNVGWAEFAHDGRHLFTHNANGTVYVLRVPEFEK